MSKFPMLSACIAMLAGCSALPTGPSVLVLPGTGKDFGQFKTDDAQCRQLALGQIASLGKEADSRDAGQRGYDINYIQCMYSKGHRVPVPAELSYDTPRKWNPPPPPNLPPPAAGSDSATPKPGASPPK